MGTRETQIPNDEDIFFEKGRSDAEERISSRLIPFVTQK